MSLIRLIIAFWALSLPAFAAGPAPVVFQGERVTIVHDGSASFYDPHTETGRLAIQESRGLCCVEAPDHWHGRSEGFGLKGDPDHHIDHESLRFVVNPRTGAFVASTFLEDTRYPATDPKRYIDADATPMVALTPEQIALCNCKPGDRVFLSDTAHHQNAWAVYGVNAGDQPDGAAFIGISVGAAEALHIPINVVTKNPTDPGYRLTMKVYPGSGYGGRFPHGPIPPVNKP